MLTTYTWMILVLGSIVVWLFVMGAFTMAIALYFVMVILDGIYAMIQIADET